MIKRNIGKLICMTAALAAVGLFMTQPSRAATYNYIGNALNNGGHVEASVDLNCVGPCSGIYVYGAGLTSFSLSAFDNLNNPVFSIASSDLSYHGASFVDFVNIDAGGTIFEWWLLRTKYPILTYIYTLYCITQCSNGDDTYSLAANPPSSSLYDTNYPISNPGVWSVSDAAPAVPIPAALPLFAAGLSAMGFMGWRRKRKNTNSETIS